MYPFYIGIDLHLKRTGVSTSLLLIELNAEYEINSSLGLRSSFNN